MAKILMVYAVKPFLALNSLEQKLGEFPDVSPFSFPEWSVWIGDIIHRLF